MKSLAKITALAIALTCIVCVHADRFSFNPTMRFRIESKVASGSAIAIGSRHGINSPVCIATTNTGEDDCYWYFHEYKTGKYAIRNAQTGQYLVWDEVRSDSPIRRYLHLDYAIRSDSALWTMGKQSDGTYYFQSAIESSYCFNVRTGSYALGTYRQGGTPSAYNELFYIYKEDGSQYDQETDSNTMCGIDKDGYYWADYDMERPLAYTTDEADPILYAITNKRSGLYVSPTSYLAQTDQEPDKLFYFREAQNGVQIMVEGEQYVSAQLPTTTSANENDIAIVSGTPKKDDHVWSITYNKEAMNAGYNIGVVACSLNSSNNPHLSNSSVYWNDFFNKGICFYGADEGSTFTFKSKDIRHRNYLAGLGLVIPSDTETPVTPVDPPAPSDTIYVEPIQGSVTHVYRADGKIDAIPTVYIERLEQSTDSVKITTKADGPVYNYATYEVDSVSTTVPGNFPKFNSFKFNNKYNPHLIGDAIGVFYGDTLITVTPICIGKRLRPSFKIDHDAEVYIGNELQKSKASRTRYDNDVVYTIARRGHTILRRTNNNTYLTYPYGQQTTVRVTYATDQATAQYKVPTVYITTDNGTMISSKTSYLDAKITIDGAGVFPDMSETAMQIKGRGNSSWAGAWGKSPYHMKFAIGVKPLGLTKGKHWNLIANAQTYSMTTNAIAMKMAQLVETAGYNHEIPIELYINGQYRGSYNLTEKVGFANNSIDLLDETYAVMLELDSYYDEPYKFRTTKYYLPVNIKEPDLSQGTSPLTSVQINQHFNKAMTALYNGEDIDTYIDLDYLARFLFVDELSFNTEFMHPKSTFCYNENITNSNSKYIFGPVWDFDWGYGYQFTSNYFTYPAKTNFWNSTTMEAKIWVNDLRYCSEKLDRIYYNLWHNFINDGRLDELIEYCQDYYDYAAESFTHDNSMWGRGDAASYATVTTRAKKWLKERANYIYDYMSNTLGYAGKDYLASTDNTVNGDVNGDGAVTTADIVCVLNYMLNLPNEDFNYSQADQDSNNMITVNDVLAIRELTTNRSASGRFYGLPEAGATLSMGTATHRADGVDIPLDICVAEGDYSGLQFDMSIPKGMSVTNLDIDNSIPDFNIFVKELNYPNNTEDSKQSLYRVSLYSSGNNKLPQGHSVATLSLEWSENQNETDMLTASTYNVLFANSTGEDERSQSQSTRFCNTELTGIGNTAWIAHQDGNQLTFGTMADTIIPIYGIDGKLFRLCNTRTDGNTITLPPGVYVINKKKITVK